MTTGDDGGAFGRWAEHHHCVYCLSRRDLAVVAWLSAGCGPCPVCWLVAEPMSNADYFHRLADVAEAVLDSYRRVWS